MPVHEFEIEQNPAFVCAGSERAGPGAEALPAGQAWLAGNGRVASAHARQVRKQTVNVFVTDLQVVNVQYRVAQAGAHQAITDVMHIGEGIDLESRPGQFLQAVGSERGECKYTTFLEDPRKLGKQFLRLRDPREQLVGYDEIEASLLERQLAGISLHERRLRQPRFLCPRADQHRMAQVQGDDMRTSKSFAYLAAARPGRGTEIENTAAFDDERLKARQETIAGYRVHEIGAVEGRGRAIESSPDVTRIQHARTVSLFPQETP